MASDDTMRDAIAQNVEGVRQLISSGMNKVGVGINNGEGAVGEYIDPLELPMADEELLALANKWEASYAPYESKIRSRQDANKIYYLGRQNSSTAYDVSDGPIAGNLLFEALETFLPAALSRNPEPVVWSDNTPEGNELANQVKTMLQYHADVLVLRSKLALMVRKWAVDYLGVIKHGWDKDINDIKLEVRNAKNFIFDKNGYVDVYGDMKGYVGERITCTAQELADKFPKHQDYISLIADGFMGTQCTYTEWWTDEYYFCTYKDIILDKGKNYFFNYGKENKTVNPETGEESIDKEEGQNHFARPKKPYTFLSVFSFGEQPHDDTGLIEQNIPNQNRLTRRLNQIDTNIQNGNNGLALSADNFNQQTGKQAAQARKAGRPILVPSGRPVNEAIVTLPSPGLPDAFFKAADMDEAHIRGIFGTEGITPKEPTEDQTARGMILQQQFDNSRIGGGIGDRLAQVADNIFNWFVQEYYVFYDEPHMAAVLGQMKATEYIELSARDLTRKLVVSVAADSMKPKDELTLYNQAAQLLSEGNLDPKTYFTVTNFPNAEETAAQVWLYKSNPQLYGQMNFPQLSAEIQQMMGAAGATAGPPGAEGAPGGGAPPTPGTPPPSVGAEPANSALNSVPLPK